MRLPRLFLDAELETGQEIDLPRDRAHYLLHVLRLTPGARLTVFDGRRPQDFSAELIQAGRKQARLRLGTARANPLESPLDSLLIQAVGKPDSIDWLVQKTTELGLRRLRLFNAERTQTPLRGARRAKKLAHWRAIAASACEQCGRSLLPGIDFVEEYDSALVVEGERSRLMLDFDGTAHPSALGKPSAPSALACLIGPEGGLSAAEIDHARQAGYAGWRLGPRVLRMETAAVTALALMQQAAGDLR